MPPISPVFANIASSLPNYKWKKSNISNPVMQPQQQQAGLIDFKKDFPWLNDKIIKASLEALRGINFDQTDIEYLKANEIRPPFKNGKEAIDFIKEKNVRIVFENLQIAMSMPSMSLAQI